MKNIFDMLKPGGGGILFIVLTRVPLFDVWKNLAKTEKWAPHFKNLAEVVSPYCDVKDPADKLKTCLENIGFVLRVCKNEDCLYTFPTFQYFFSNGGNEFFRWVILWCFRYCIIGEPFFWVDFWSRTCRIRAGLRERTEEASEGGPWERKWKSSVFVREDRCLWAKILKMEIL